MGDFTPSLLDKLLSIDDEGDLSSRGVSPRWNVERIKEAVARDIEALLNTRPGFVGDDLKNYPRVARSVLAYGLTDVTVRNALSDRDRRFITEAIVQALQDHEPRLTQVEVNVRQVADVGAGLCFSIRAKLRLDPVAEPVSFDAMLSPGSSHYAVFRSDLRRQGIGGTTE